MPSRSCRGTSTDEWFPRTTFAMTDFLRGVDASMRGRHRLAELRWAPADAVGDSELDGGAGGLQLHRSMRGAFGPELGLELVLPADRQPPQRFGLDDGGAVEHLPVGGQKLPGGSRRP